MDKGYHLGAHKKGSKGILKRPFLAVQLALLQKEKNEDPEAKISSKIVYPNVPGSFASTVKNKSGFGVA